MPDVTVGFACILVLKQNFWQGVNMLVISIHRGTESYGKVLHKQYYHRELQSDCGTLEANLSLDCRVLSVISKIR